ncbi:hypothetical protein ARMGADRAFT_1088842 [Armillaria gallica]|uniref:Uncharacterized protein n=1 Tax=Armillaria gallica TaxID=47427 RepID=A0A2H3CLE2_ARMGA|nr:hypothetical protein ARMGADRAFT_1088842 [Armillaria gallica]
MQMFFQNVTLYDTIATLDVPLFGLNVSEEQDSILFKVHYHEVVIASTNGFNKSLDHHVSWVSVTETSEILNIILHTSSRPLSEIWLGTQKICLTVIATLQRYPLQDAALTTEVLSLRASQSLFAPFVSLRICKNSASTMDLVWNNWTKISMEKPAYTTDDDNDDEKNHMHRVLRSTWERLSVAALVFMPGCITTAVAMQMHSSYVLAFDILADHRQHNLFLQTIRTGPSKGLSVPFNKAYLLPGQNKTEFMIRVDGKPTQWYIPLDDNCFIDGKKVSPQEARATITSTCRSKRFSQEIANPFLKR